MHPILHYVGTSSPGSRGQITYQQGAEDTEQISHPK